MRTVDGGTGVPEAMQVLPMENQPFLHIRFPGRGLARLSLGLAAPLAVAYSQSGLAAHRSLMAILARHLMVLSLLLVAAVLIVDSAAKHGLKCNVAVTWDY